MEHYGFLSCLQQTATGPLPSHSLRPILIDSYCPHICTYVLYVFLSFFLSGIPTFSFILCLLYVTPNVLYFIRSLEYWANNTRWPRGHLHLLACHMNARVHAVCSDTLRHSKVVCGNTVSVCMCTPCHGTLHTTHSGQTDLRGNLG